MGEGMSDGVKGERMIMCANQYTKTFITPTCTQSLQKDGYVIVVNLAVSERQSDTEIMLIPHSRF